MSPVNLGRSAVSDSSVAGFSPSFGTSSVVSWAHTAGQRPTNTTSTTVNHPVIETSSRLRMLIILPPSFP